MDRINSANTGLDDNGHRIRVAKNIANGIAGTSISSAYENGLQEELIGGLIETAGLTPDAGNDRQILAALRALAGNSSSNSVTYGGIALAGTAQHAGCDILFNGTTGEQQYTLPPAADLWAGACVKVTRSTRAGTLLVVTVDGTLIDSGAGVEDSITLVGGEEARIWWTGANWVATGTYMFRHTGPFLGIGAVYASNNYSASATSLGCSFTFTASSPGAIILMASADSNQTLTDLALTSTGTNSLFQQLSRSGGFGALSGWALVGTGAAGSITATAAQATADSMNVTLTGFFIPQVSG